MTPHGTLNRYQSGGCRCRKCRDANNKFAMQQRKQRQRRLATANVQHGKYTTYGNWGCRCQSCCTAWKEHCQQDYRNRLNRPEDAPHGTKAGYQDWGCRCADCRAAAPTKHRERQRKTLQAAYRRGAEWTGPELELASRTDLTLTEIAAMLGRSYYGVARKRHQLGIDPKRSDLAGLPRPVPPPVIFGHEIDPALRTQLK